MKTPWLTLLILLVATPCAAEVYPGDRVLLMGDSQAFMLSKPMRALVQGSGAVFRSESHAGSSVIQWAGPELNHRWAEARRFRPTVLLISLGSNDACMGVPVVRNEEPYLQRFLRRVEQVGAEEVYWIGPPTVGSDRKLRQARVGTDAFMELVHAHAPLEVMIIDSRRIGLRMLDDELHPTVESATVWATWIWEQVR